MAIRGRESFAVASSDYASERPLYPEALFDWIASRCRAHGAAWDCATGNGQAARALARRFARVAATDLSPEQIAAAFPAAGVSYSVQPAESTDFDDASFDLVAVAQALHWFDFDRFWAEVRRVARRGAFFCAWGYAWFEREPALDELHHVYLDPLVALLAPWWVPNNAILWRGYRSDDIRFPFERVPAPDFAIELRWSIERLIGYVHTWSAVKAAAADRGTAGAIATLEQAARNRFGGRGAMPLSLPLVVAAAPVS